jgi:hypothetical protein
MTEKIYLRQLIFKGINRKEELEIFRGDIKKDRAYWNKYHNVDSHYFLLGEGEQE